MEFQTLIYEENAGIGLLKISRPKALNALNAEVLKELNLFLDEAEKSATMRCLILTGDGEKSFVAGADITEIAELDVDQARKFAEHGQKTFMRLEVLQVPVIAAVNGFALGGGLELALACDFIVCSNKARFGLPEVSLGIMPGFGGTQRLRQAVGLRRAREMTFTGNHYDAQAAENMGLVNEVTEPEALIEACMKLARAVCKKAPIAVTKSKQAILRGADISLAEGMAVEAKSFSELFATQDAREGTQAFLQKRAPEFQGK